MKTENKVQSKAEQILLRRQKVKKLLDKGCSYSEIANILETSYQTIARDILQVRSGFPNTDKKIKQVLADKKREKEERKQRIGTDNESAEIIKQWLQYCEFYYAARTCENYRIRIKAINKFLHESGKELIHASPSDLISFLMYTVKQKNCRRIGQKITNRTANVALTAIKSFFRWYSQQNGGNNPAAEVDLLKEKPPRQRCLTEKEYQKVLAVAAPIEQAVIRFLSNTGLRAQEFKDLSPPTIDMKKKFITVTGKGGKRRVIPINDVVKQIIENYPDLEFVTQYRIWRRLYALCEKLAYRANVERFGPHACRHFFATRLITAGIPVIKVSRILGHANTRITELTYTHIMPIHLAGVLDVLSF